MRLIQAFKEEGRYEGVVSSFTHGDPTVVACDLKHLEHLMMLEDDRLKFLNQGSTPPPALPLARRGNKKPAADPKPSAPPKSPPAPHGQMQVSYPPSQGIKWKELRDLIKSKSLCPFCFTKTKSFHWEVGCPALAAAGIITVEDKDASKALLDKFNERYPRASDDADKKPAKPPGARRATSADRSKPPPPSPTPSPPDPASENRFGPLSGSCTYVDGDEIESDYSDGAEIDTDFSTSDSKTNSSGYTVTATARKARANNVSKVLSTHATDALSSHKDSISTPVPSESECCADSGATDHMFPDYSTFTSYRLTPGCFIELGDGTRLEQRGIGSVKIRLNGKIIILRNCLHVPALQDPLYSLRRHRMLPGCGNFSRNETGSHLLFPTFVLEVDTSVDNILSYQSVGRDNNEPIDYYEPRNGDPLARQTHLIPPEPVNEMRDVEFAYMPPKSIPTRDLPKTPPPVETTSQPPTVIHDDELLANSKEQISHKTLALLHADPSDLPPVPPAHTPAPAERRTEFDPLKLHRISGCCRFRNQQHVIAASANAKLVKCGELPATLGDFTTINKPDKGKPIKKHRKYLDKVHMDIVFGDCLALGGYRYALLLVDVATWYCWLYGMQALTSNEIISCLEQFKSAAKGIPKTFHSDFDQKLIGGKARRWILEQNSRIIAAPANRQTLVRMGRAYITEKQLGREYWYFAVKQSSIMINRSQDA